MKRGLYGLKVGVKKISKSENDRIDKTRWENKMKQSLKEIEKKDEKR